MKLFLKSPAFSAIAVLTIALGIGANIAIFSSVYTVLFRSLPFEQADQLVSARMMVQRDGGPERRGFSMPDFRDYRARLRSFTGFSAYADGANYNLTGDGEAARVRVAIISHDFFATLRVQPQLGRAFTAEEDSVPDQHPVVILSHDLWQNRYASDPTILGRTIILTDVSYTVVGVMPATFRGFDGTTQLWMPMAMSGASVWNNRSARWHEVVARVRPGVTPDQARAEMEAVAGQLARESPSSNADYTTDLASLRTELLGHLRNPLLVLMGAVGLVLIITCANVANLMLVRLSRRQREIAIRLSLGARRRDLVGLFLGEAMTLSIAGGAVALLLAVWLVELLNRINPGDLPTFLQGGLQWPVFAFAVFLVLLCALAIGLLPAFLAGRSDTHAGLKDGGRSQSAGAGGTRIRNGLIVAEIALSLALLLGSALLVRSFLNLVDQSPGYRTEKILSLSATLPGQRYPRAAVQAFTRQLLERAAALPGVQSAALASDLPLDGNSNAIFASKDGAVTAEDGESRVYSHSVTPDYFKTLGINFRSGTTFAASYAANSEPVVIISENLARRFWPKGDAVGARLKTGRIDSNGPWTRVVGVVAETKYRSLTAPSRDPDLYFAYDQRLNNRFALVVHTGGASSSLASSFRQLIPSIDANVPVFGLISVEERVARASAGQRFNAQMMTAFGALALLLAAIGLYGVVSFSVVQRTQEIGVRLALGAQPADVLRLVLGGTARLVLLGIVSGLALSLVLIRFIESQLFAVSAHDPLTLSGVTLLLVIVAFCAALLPARRATRVDPMVALRSE